MNPQKKRTQRDYSLAFKLAVVVKRKITQGLPGDECHSCMALRSAQIRTGP